MFKLFNKLFERGRKQVDRKEAEIQSVRADMFDKIDKASNQINKSVQETKKLNTLLEKNGGVTLKIFYATGGDRRKSNG